MVSAWHVDGTRDSDTASSAANEIEMSVVRGMRECSDTICAPA